MQYIDERFKERRPEETVSLILHILNKYGIEVTEIWNDSGVPNCFSLSLIANGGIPSSNGKGVTRELARASAYGEFIERLQGGLFFYKYQSIGRDKTFNIHTFAPEAKYVTVQELIENGDWMDEIIKEYNDSSITRQSIANLCKMYDVSGEGSILVLPFYSLFEKKYVFLPMGFVDNIYATNGCCVGNTRNEAWVHALSEMLERNATLKMLLSGNSVPRFSDEVIRQFPTVSEIVEAIRKKGHFEIDIFDCSFGSGFPIVSTRIINKKTHTYHVNTAADPILEIALQRTLTESFQGRNIDRYVAKHQGQILNKVNDFPIHNNIVNQLETGNGLYTADYFANELTCNAEASQFADNSSKTNTELLEYALSVYRKKGKQVYVRNFSYLGFPCYRFVVPGFSEAFISQLSAKLPEYAMGDAVCRAMKQPLRADISELSMLLTYSKMMALSFSRNNNFSRQAGVLLTNDTNFLLSSVTKAYAYYQLNRYDDAIKTMDGYIGKSQSLQYDGYFAAVNKYLQLINAGIDKEIIKNILFKFFDEKDCNKLYEALDNGRTPYDEFLLDCNCTNCDGCRYKNKCLYHINRDMCIRIGKEYSRFVHGQAEEEFAI